MRIYLYVDFKKYYKDMEFLDKVCKPKDMEQLENKSKQLAKSIETLRDKKFLEIYYSKNPKYTSN